ncbi:MAG: glycosyl hydrolase, partial [Planctomycetota bacterium]|nr:glycosyl hydrolase [Planctomycetota bacterium]
MSRSRVFTLLLIAMLAALVFSGSVATAADFEKGFQSPADADKPWAYWWWLKANVDEKSITSDLEEMRDKGFGGLLLFDARGYHEGHVPPPPSRADFMSPQWRRMVKYSMSEANRLGITISINLSSCAGALKGPWNVGADSPKKLVWTAVRVPGPKPISCRLKRPESLKHFNDIAVMAVRRADGKVIKPTTDLDADLAANWRKITPLPKNSTVVDQVVDLSDKVDAQGQLSWNVPAGSWIIFRFAYAAMENHEFDVDVLDPQAVAGHYGRMGKTLVEDAGPLAGKTLTHFYSVSWEGAIPTWTGAFEKMFEKYRGYDIRQYMPVLAGMTLKNTDISKRFIADYYKTLGDGFRDNFYGTLRRLSNRDGIKWHSESGGPWSRGLPTFRNADQLSFLGCNDMPQGEFWYPGRYMNRQPAMAAHVYGRRLAATEAFTHMQRHWDVYPAALKPSADATFCDGINQFIWHTFTASPPELGKPGFEYFAGTHINPRVTWWQQAGPMLAYLARCQYMLRQGLFTADVCAYVGDAPYQHWGRWKTWRPGSFLQVGKGHGYDLITTEALVERAKVENGHIVLPDGMRYSVLAVDLATDTVPLEALQKIVELAKAGATVVLGDVRAANAPGLKNYPDCNAEAARLGNELWGAKKSAKADARKPLLRELAQGKVYTGTSLDAVFKAAGVLPDFEGPF